MHQTGTVRNGPGPNFARQPAQTDKQYNIVFSFLMKVPSENRSIESGAFIETNAAHLAWVGVPGVLPGPLHLRGYKPAMGRAIWA